MGEHHTFFEFVKVLICLGTLFVTYLAGRTVYREIMGIDPDDYLDKEPDEQD